MRAESSRQRASEIVGEAPISTSFVLPKPIVFVLAALAFLFAIDLFAWAAYRDVKQASDELTRHVNTLERLQALPKIMLEMESNMRGYLLTGSNSSLNRYRAAADQLPGITQRALILVEEDPKQHRLIEAAAAAARDWLARYASPMVVKRNAGSANAESAAALGESMRQTAKYSKAERIRAQFEESIHLEREQVMAAQGKLTRKLQRIAMWIKARAFALLLALAALTLLLGRILAKLTGQMHSREIAEHQMRTSSANMRAISAASPLGMFMADGLGACVQANGSFERMTGLAEADILGNGWQSALHPEDQKRVVFAWNAFTTSGMPFSSVHRFVHRNGKVVWTSMKCNNMTDGDRLIGFACSIEDISERREAEEALGRCDERLHLALEHSRLALFDWHIPSGEVSLSREWNIAMGYGPQELTTTTRRLNELIHPDDVEAFGEAIASTLKTGKSMSRVELRVETRGGQWKRVYLSGRVAERDAAGRAVRLIGTIASD
ncbi:MAG TPA: PAS domain-containing protein [Burkholderiales bacterium]|nr:PAS domain-containing protein [Burkholderiales bacterium]